MKALYLVGLLMLASAGGLLVSCAKQWSQERPGRDSYAARSVVEQSRVPGGHGQGSTEDITSPLVTQARAFALYLNPPQPPEPKTIVPPRVNPPAHQPPVVAPKFRLLAISYYHASPERSLAMVSEPGKGSYWIRQGDRLGHVTVERIGAAAIFYRDGNQSREMRVDVKSTMEIGQLKSTAAVSTARIGRTGDR